MSTARNYQLTIEPREGYLYTRVDADSVDLGMIVESFNEMFLAVREHGYNALLFVRHAPLLTTSDSRRLVAALVRNMLPEGTRLAVVDTYPHNSQAEKNSAERATRAAGLNLRAFETVGEAERWLLE